MQGFPIKLGKGRNPVTLDSAHLVDGCALIQGTRGSGKSYLARVIVEETIDNGLQTIVLDPEGEFGTLREKCDLLIAGRDGDVPCEPRSAKLLARRIAETGVSAVIDLSDLKLDQRREMVRVFLDTLCNLPRSLEAPRVVVLDEAHVYCPESGKGKATSTDAVITLMSQGRKRGLGAILLTQRLSKLKKDAAAEAAHLFIGKTSPVDLNTAQDLLGVTKKEKDALRTLDPGTFYAAGPGLSVPEPSEIHTRKARTTHPKAGSRHKTTTPPPKQAISKILKEFQELPPSKEDEEAQNTADLKKRMRELERELSNSRKQASDSGQLRALEAQLSAERKQHQAALGKYDKLLADVQLQLKKTISFLTGGKPETVLPPPPTKVARTPPTKAGGYGGTRNVPSGPLPEKLTFGWKSAPGKLLTVLIQYYPEKLSAQRLASLAGIHQKRSTFRNALTDLRTNNVVEQRGQSFAATSEAISAYNHLVPPLPSGDELIAGWAAKLGNGVPRRIFDVLVSFKGQKVHKKDAASDADVDPSSSTFRNALTDLRKYGLLESGRGEALSLTPHVIEAIR